MSDDWTRELSKYGRRVAENLGQVEGLYLLTVAERHQLCSCTWVYDYRSAKFRLKYRDVSCLAGYWHYRIERKP